MGGRTHMVFGAASFALLAGPVSHLAGQPHVPVAAVPVGLLVGALAGLMPDLDEPGALLARGTWVPRRLGWLVRFVVQVVSLPLRLLGVLLKGMLGHRGGTHSLALAAICTLLCAIAITVAFGSSADWLIWTIAFGYVSHLVADSLNPSGVPWVWPVLSKRRTFHLLPKPLRIPTESPPNLRERVVRFQVAAGTVICIGVFYVAIPLAGL